METKYLYNFSNHDSRDSLAAYLTRLKKSSLHVVFTNGCFDILHVGHLRYLKAARAEGDRLIIGLNTDASVSKIKGPLRPVVCERERAELLLGLECVDCVTLFDEPTPKDIIEFIKPDVLVKGAQYEEKDIVGASFVKSYGGRLVRAAMIENTSTSNIIEKITRSYTGAFNNYEKK